MEDKTEYVRVMEALAGESPGTSKYDQLLREANELLHIRKSYVEAYPPPPPTGLKALLQNSALVGFGRDVVITAAVLQHERVNVISSRVFSFVKTDKSKG